jgi:hypothetical protein
MEQPGERANSSAHELLLRVDDKPSFADEIVTNPHHFCAAEPITIADYNRNVDDTVIRLGLADWLLG